MSDKPILFSGPMIRAILAGAKSQTRRLAKAPSSGPEWFCDRVGPTGFQWTGEHGSPQIPFTPRWAVEDRLWVRETWRAREKYDRKPNAGLHPGSRILFEADAPHESGLDLGKARPSIFMPRWASRVTLVVTEVRVQPLNDISEDDCWAEGIEAVDGMFDMQVPAMAARIGSMCEDGKSTFACLWESINGVGSWSANPWVAAVSFTAHKANIDSLAASPSPAVPVSG